MNKWTGDKPDRWQDIYVEIDEYPNEDAKAPEHYIACGPWEPFSTFYHPEYRDESYSIRGRMVTGWKRPLIQANYAR